MEAQLSEESVWAAALAGRLRSLQASFADDDPAARQTYLVEEIERSLKGHTPEKRRVLLGALAMHFPSWLVAGSASPADTASPALPTPVTPEEQLDQLLAALPRLTDAQRADFVAKLKAAGLVPEPAPAAPAGVELPADLQKRLGVSSDHPVDAERAAVLLAQLLDLVLTMDQLIWMLWKQLAARSSLRREADLARLSADFLAGSGEVTSAQLAQALERTRKMVAGLLGAIGRAGGAYAREQARLFDPAAIEADARSEKKWNESLEYACWRKYVQLCKEYGAEPAIEKAIQEAVAKGAENLILGRPAK